MLHCSIKPKSYFSQNFLFDQNIIHKIINSSFIDSDTHVIEIGPGLGSLTKAILIQNPKFITLVEIDKRFSEILATMQSKNLRIIYQDILKLNLEEVFIPSLKNIVISNLPYHIASKILLKLSKYRQIARLVLMLQKDLGARILSEYNKKSYGRLSVILQNLYKIEKLFDVSRFCFYPVPEVQSSILSFIPIDISIQSEVVELLEELVKQAFSARRKLLTTNLKISNIEVILQNLSINKSIRAENLSPRDYLKITKLIIANR